MDLSREIKFGKRKIQVLDLLMVAGVFVIGIMVRACLGSYESGDWEVFLKPWTDILKEGGFKALKVGYYNYTPIYMYILWFITILPIDTLMGIKIVSTLFDLILAIVTAKIVKELSPRVNPIITFGIVWLLPTVISNSSMWGQCDSIYTSFVMICLLYLLKENYLYGMFFYGIAFAIKLQSIFFAPVLLLLFFMKKIRFSHVLLIPAIYIISIIPVWIAGRPLKELLLIYYGQTGSNPTLSVIYPNIYYLIGNDVFVELYNSTAILFTLGVLLVLMYFVLKHGYRAGISQNILIQTALAAGSIIVFLLPNMRERYSYMIDILAIIYAMTNWQKFYVPLIRVTISFLAYTTYYRYGIFTSFETLAVIQILLIADGVYTLVNYYLKDNGELRKG